MGRRTLAAVAGVLVLSGCTSGSSGPDRRALECPSAPFQPRISSGDLERAALRGPARADVSHGVFVHRLTLDGGALTVSRPRARDRAGYPGGEALCEVMASTTANGYPIGRQSPDTVAAGLARVTVDPTLPSLSQGLYGKPPTGPSPARYDDRLAWVVVVSPSFFRSSGKGGVTCPPVPKGQRPTYDNYVVFVVDARTGGDALLYTAGNFGAICPGQHKRPHVDVPMTAVSMPWRLVSERPDRSRAQIAIDVTSCDGYPPEVLAAHATAPALIRVVVSRPFGPPCGPAKEVVVSARAYDLHATLSATLAHAPVGPYVEG